MLQYIVVNSTTYARKGVYYGFLTKAVLKVNCKINDKYCGKCCYNTEMPLVPEDISRIEELGYSREFFVDDSSGIPRLRNINGHCVFLDPATNACKIYEYRPIGCRLYPLVYDASTGTVTVDKLCPRWREVSMNICDEHVLALHVLVRKIYGDNASI